jgi:hypothetical protein
VYGFKKHRAAVMMVTCAFVKKCVYQLKDATYQHDLRDGMRLQPGCISNIATPAIIKLREISAINTSKDTKEQEW